jgi:hypothetical protein
MYDYTGLYMASALHLTAEQTTSTRSVAGDYTTSRKANPIGALAAQQRRATFDTQPDECYTYPTKQEEKKTMEWEWSFTGGNEIASGYRTGLAAGACTPATRRQLRAGEPLMVDLHAMYKLGLGDHAHNYLLGPATPRQRWHAQNFVDLVDLCLRTYRPGMSPSRIADEMLDFCEERGFADYMVPGFEHGIGLMGDEWRIGLEEGPIPYWTDPDHRYQDGELLICAMQYACPEEDIGFRYENPILITEDGCEALSKFQLGIEEI